MARTSQESASLNHEHRIADHRITNFGSFQKVVEEPRQIAGLYFYQLLDCLVDLSYTVSCDFRKRPQLYRELGIPSIAPILAKLNVKYGTEVNLLSKTQRDEIYMPLFGNWDSLRINNDDNFPGLRDELLSAAAAFAERTVDTGVSMLRERVRATHRLFKDYLVGLQGESVKFSQEIALLDLTENICYPILRNPAIGSIFGIAKAASPNYPYNTDSSEHILVEQASKQFVYQGIFPSFISRGYISNLQRTALRGAEAIATVIDFEEADSEYMDADLDLLITKCYTWGSALKGLSSYMKTVVSPTQPSGGNTWNWSSD
jgi:hypothetical protein